MEPIRDYPRFSDGRPVRPGDEVYGVGVVDSVELFKRGYLLKNGRTGYGRYLRYGETVHHIVREAE